MTDPHSTAGVRRPGEVLDAEHLDYLESRADDVLEREQYQRERTLRGGSLAILYGALVPALGELDDIAKTRTAQVDSKTGASYRYSYAGLADVLGDVRPVLARRGLALTQRVTTDLAAGTVTVATRILHIDGDEYDAGRITFPLGATAQAVGSTISYARRYAILAALGIAGADDDDDGQAASTTPAPPLAPSRSRPRMISKSQMQKIGALMDAAGIDRDDGTRRALVAGIIGRTVKSRGELTAAEGSTMIDAVQAVVDGTARIEPADDGAPRIVRVEQHEERE